MGQTRGSSANSCNSSGASEWLGKSRPEPCTFGHAYRPTDAGYAKNMAAAYCAALPFVTTLATDPDSNEAGVAFASLECLTAGLTANLTTGDQPFNLKEDPSHVIKAFLAIVAGIYGQERQLEAGRKRAEESRYIAACWPTEEERPTERTRILASDYKEELRLTCQPNLVGRDRINDKEWKTVLRHCADIIKLVTGTPSGCLHSQMDVAKQQITIFKQAIEGHRFDRQSAVAARLFWDVFSLEQKEALHHPPVYQALKNEKFIDGKLSNSVSSYAGLVAALQEHFGWGSGNNAPKHGLVIEYKQKPQEPIAAFLK